MTQKHSQHFSMHKNIRTPTNVRVRTAKISHEVIENTERFALRIKYSKGQSLTYLEGTQRGPRMQ